MKTNYNYQLIHDYLHGLTDQKTSMEIKQLIKNDEVTRSIAEGIVHLENKLGSEEAVEIYLENFRERQLSSIQQPSAQRPITKKLWFRMAASLLLLISVGAVVRLMVATPDLQTLVNNELAEPYPLSNLVRGESDGSAKEKAFQLYAQGDFTNATIYFEQASTNEKENATVVFYNALSYLYQENFAKANALLKSDVIAGSRYSKQAEWYRALALIQSGNLDEGKVALTSIADQVGHFKHEAANRLLKKME